MARVVKKAQSGIIRALAKGVEKAVVKDTEKAAVRDVWQQQAKRDLTKAIERRTSPKAKPSYLDEFDMPSSKNALKATRREVGLKSGNGRPYKKGGKVMLKRADGSYSQRGLWDNIRAAKGSGKKPTSAMLKQEKKIKAKTKK